MKLQRPTQPWWTASWPFWSMVQGHQHLLRPKRLIPSQPRAYSTSSTTLIPWRMLREFGNGAGVNHRFLLFVRVSDVPKRYLFLLFISFALVSLSFSYSAFIFKCCRNFGDGLGMNLRCSWGWGTLVIILWIFLLIFCLYLLGFFSIIQVSFFMFSFLGFYYLFYTCSSHLVFLSFFSSSPTLYFISFPSLLKFLPIFSAQNYVTNFDLSMVIQKKIIKGQKWMWKGKGLQSLKK